MALNKFMHPRNIYRTPPDFVKLYKEFEDFSTVAKMDVTGKVSIDFKDTRALRILTKCLLKSDFDLDVVIPEDRLVPTLPLRLNYILWIEDLMISIHKEHITGLDIGTGACAIYPLLAANKNKWHMVGTEKDEDSLKMALDNIERNNLQHLIKLKKNITASLIEHLFEEDNDLRFDFCMCNPPFYSNVQEVLESRSSARPPPKNAFTGSPQELITEGGELEFCRKLIKESAKFKNHILIFTTMIGHKYNMKEILLDLKAEGINHTTTEFCQGRVTRWAIAWTYQDYDLYNLVPPRDKARKKSIPITFVLPEIPNLPYDVEHTTEKVQQLFDSLNIQYKIITKRRNETVLNFNALTNTWTNQRRKRRLLKKIEETVSKKQKLENQEKCEKSTPDSSIDEKSNVLNETMDLATACSTALIDQTDTVTNKDTEKPILQGIFKVSNKAKTVVFEMEYLEGSAGKEGVHQILQYIKNNWK
ncbi:PREDICTED: methyltransferase-like protein 16 [Papilio xuthus]|uniref:U6 small nuclear RNA (adenine-(43)-N(6))-methyltransferase n=1 Tax=Papilio xuthus TaxID=66420 RepID=A0AAJ6Z3T8_PAPXU|nr:PREDICTED: methyltransferase-like protein 16 [Papilio xuthus]